MRICCNCWRKLFLMNSANSFFVDEDFALSDDDLLCVIESGKCVHCRKDSNQILGGAFDEISFDDNSEISEVKKTSQRTLRQHEYESLLQAIRVARLNLLANAETISLIDDCFEDDFGDHPNYQPDF